MAKRDDKPRPSPRIFGLVASAARTAVIFRRGPSKQVQMLRWDLATDQVTQGQWLSGRVYDERCGISPDGRLVVYFAGKFKTRIGTFTAVSRPPYFTALALWPDGSTYGGGGFFEGNRRLILNYGYVIAELNQGSTIPPDFEVGAISEYRQRRGADTPESRQGWTLTHRGSDGVYESDQPMHFTYADPWIYEKQNPAHPRWALERTVLGAFEVNLQGSVHSYRLVERTGDVERSSVPLGRFDWADWDHDGSLVFASDGCLFRRPTIGTRAGDRPAAARIADLRAHVFTNMLPPDRAREWP